MSNSLQYGKFDVEEISPGFTMGADTERPQRCPDCLYGIYGYCARRAGLCYVGKKKEPEDDLS